MNIEFIIDDLKKSYFKDRKIKIVTEILKGYSFDKKFYIEDDMHNKYVLRLSDFNILSKKEKEFAVMKEIETLQVKMSRPILIASNENEGVCFQLVSYIEGQDALESLKDYSLDTQYKIGLEAGRELKKMHYLKAPSAYKDWYEIKVNKNARYVEAYKTLGIKIKGEENIINFMNKNIDLMRNRPNHFQHDDFHVGNIIIKDGNYAGVIDFNRYDYGDPIHDFYKVPMFSAEVSIPFCIGQINGYFNNQVPDNFWKLYTLYVAMSLFPTIVWSKKYYPEDLDDMIERVDRMYEEHKGFERMIPTWYQ